MTTSRLFGVYGVLLALLGLTVAASFAPLGGFNPVVSFAIAGTKAGLILWFYMHLREEGGFVRLVAVAAGLWLAILLGLTGLEVLTRTLT